jgi:hypothetical protein
MNWSMTCFTKPRWSSTLKSSWTSRVTFESNSWDGAYVYDRYPIAHISSETLNVILHLRMLCPCIHHHKPIASSNNKCLSIVPFSNNCFRFKGNLFLCRVSEYDSNGVSWRDCWWYMKSLERDWLRYLASVQGRNSLHQAYRPCPYPVVILQPEVDPVRDLDLQVQVSKGSEG